MKVKNEKGVTLIDIAVSIIIITIFVAVNTAILYNSYIRTIETKRNDGAVKKLIQKLEDIKNSDFKDVNSESSAEDGYKYEIVVENYKEIIKKVTVTVSYDFFEGKEEQKTQKFTITTLKAQKE